MKIFRKILKLFIYFLLIPISYLLAAAILSNIIVNDSVTNTERNRSIFLSTNGVHLNIVIPKADIIPELLDGLYFYDADKYLMFGWGDENFYINTPTWNELTFANAFRALFIKSTTLMHVTRYKEHRNYWVEVNLSDTELEKLNRFILNSFRKDYEGNKIMLENKGFSINDNFYKAIGYYTLFYTCNTWVNAALKESGLKASVWTPLDFGVLNIYQ